MPLTTGEILEDVLTDLVPIYQGVESAIAKLPPAEQRGAKDYTALAGFGEGSAPYALAAAFDQFEEALKTLPPKEQRTAADYAKLLGLAPDSAGFHAFTLVDKVIAQAKT